jgi:hypothetical protein
VIIVKFAPELKPVLKHETHDQASHGSWASGELSDDQIRNIVYNSKTVNEMYQEIARLQGKSMKPKVAELSEDEVNLYRGVANSERDTAQLLEGKIPFTELQTWGQGIYATPDKGEASSYGQVIGIKLDKSAKLVQGELAWDKSFKVKFTDTGIESDWFDFDRTLEQIKRGEKDNFSVSDLRNLYWAGKGYDGFQPFDRETVLFNADKVTINSKDIKSGITKHATHDQSSHGNWASGGSGGFKDYSSQPQEFYQHYESTYLIDGSRMDYVKTYQQAGADINREIREKWDSADEDSRKLVLEIDLAMNESLPLDENTILYRGMRGEGISNFKVGDVLTDKGYVSTTVHKEFADGWANNLTSGYIVKIEAQAGQKGIITNFYTADTMFADEYEFLLPRNTSIEITSIDTENKMVGAKIVNN